MTVVIHSIPTIGTVQIRLDGYPEQLYKLMNRLGEIDRLKKLHHLGVLQYAFPGMKHTRWDYTLTSLYLLQLFSEARYAGLSPNVKMSGVLLSGRDMLQILALLSNIGHLPGTFAVEKGVLHCLISHNILADLLTKAGLKRDSQIDYLNINRVFCLIKLRKWLSKANENEGRLLKIGIQLITELVTKNPGSLHRERIFNLFHMTRRVAYQIVDCLYANLPIRIDYVEFTRQITKFAAGSLHWEPMIGLMDDYTRIVYQQIYHAETLHNDVIGFTVTVCDILKKSNDLIDEISEHWLMASSLEDIGIDKMEKKYELMLGARLPHKFGPDFMIESLLDKTVDKIEVDFTKFIPNARLLILYIPGLRDPITQKTSAGDLSIDVFTEKGISIENSLKTAALILIWCYNNLQDTFGQGTVLKAFLEGIFRLASERSDITVSINVYPEEVFRDVDVPYLVLDDHINIYRVKEKKKAMKIFRRNEDDNWNSTIKEQFYESRIAREMIKRRWPSRRLRRVAQFIVLIPARIHFLKGKKELCEFDGGMLIVKERNEKITEMSLFLLEAKSGKRSSKFESNKQLAKNFHGIGGFYNDGKIFNLKGKNAYGVIRLVCKEEKKEIGVGS